MTHRGKNLGLAEQSERRKITHTLHLLNQLTIHRCTECNAYLLSNEEKLIYKNKILSEEKSINDQFNNFTFEQIFGVILVVST